MCVIQIQYIRFIHIFQGPSRPMLVCLWKVHLVDFEIRIGSEWTLRLWCDTNTVTSTCFANKIEDCRLDSK